MYHDIINEGHRPERTLVELCHKSLPQLVLDASFILLFR